jgi:hypothetical protein
MSETKRCRRCGHIKPTTEFHNNAAASDGLQSRCKECSKLARREWYARPGNAAKECARTQRWARNNPAKYNAIKARYRANHLEAHRAYMRAYMRRYYANKAKRQ